MKKQLLAFTSVMLLPLCMSLSVNAADRKLMLDDSIQAENGSITLEDGQTWYKVNYFEDDKPYLITLENPDGAEQLLTCFNLNSENYIWNYNRETNTSSTRAPHSSLVNGIFSLSCSETETNMVWNSDLDSASDWEYDGSTLCFSSHDTKHYVTMDPDSSTGIGATEDSALAGKVNIYTHGRRLGRCILTQPVSKSYVLEDSGYDAPSYSISLTDAEIVPEKVIWYVDGTAYETNSLQFTADCLTNLPTGMHRISCTIEAQDTEYVHYRESSSAATFFITKGILPDSILTFSDLHEEFDNIGDAIGMVLEESGGYLPSLIVCTGDWVNGPAGDYDRVMNWYYPRIQAQLGGLDSVYVAGNHDYGEAAAEMTRLSDLGAEIDGNMGIIFRGNSPEAANGTSGQFASNTIVYGINYQAAVSMVDGQHFYSYQDVLAPLEEFLSRTAENYTGEMIIISAHSGLHVLGVQPECISSSQTHLAEWIGEMAYNVDLSDEVASLLNFYAETYNMDILYLFGHDHSRQETEFLLTEGDTLYSTHYYAERNYTTIPLHFSYGHAGYLSTDIGCAAGRFLFVYRNADTITTKLMELGSGIVHEDVIPLKYEPLFPPATEPETIAESAAPTETTETLKEISTSSPNTGDKGSALSLLILALGTMFLTKRKSA